MKTESLRRHRWGRRGAKQTPCQVCHRPIYSGRLKDHAACFALAVARRLAAQEAGPCDPKA